MVERDVDPTGGYTATDAGVASHKLSIHGRWEYDLSLDSLNTVLYCFKLKPTLASWVSRREN